LSQVTLLLGASLRRLFPESRGGEVSIGVDGPLAVRELLEVVGIQPTQARILLLNHKKAYLDSVVHPGDRLAVFPPELAFNMYVALELAHNEATVEEVEGRSSSEAESDD
jgi:hypothetical protein